MNIFEIIHKAVLDAIDQMALAGDLPHDLNTKSVTIETPRDPLHGDIATNAAMVLAKAAGQKPRIIADQLIGFLLKNPFVKTADVAGPGFINLRLSDRAIYACLKAVLSDPDYGRSKIGNGKDINVEYVSVNPTGPLHIGHVRGAVFGDALASLLEFAGYQVVREYYINDAGAQIDALARSVYLRYAEAHGLSVTFDSAAYPGDYLVPVGQALKEKYGEAYLDKPEASWLPVFREFSVEAMMGLIKADLASLGIEMDSFFSEKHLADAGKVEEAFALLKKRGLIYQGTLPPPKGKLPDDWEEREQTLFRSTDFGDDVDRPIKKADGSWTYFAPDIAYHFDKIQRGFDLLIDVFGADHGGYVKRMNAAVAALSGEKTSFDIKIVQIVRLFKDGAPYKMSKRMGNFITLRQFIDEVGVEVARFYMLTRRNDAVLDFDFQKAREQSQENPVFYVQYAHARAQSLLRKSAESGLDVSDNAIQNAELELLCDPSEQAVIRKLAEFPRLIEAAARANEPHRIAFYLYELASAFHAQWAKGNANPDLKFLQTDNQNMWLAKMALVCGVRIVISTGLTILGIKPVAEMR